MTILPLTAILFQILFLTIAIAIESFVIHKKLYLSQRTSIQYAASLNLFSTILGLATFFWVNSLLPFEWQQQLINFILFGNLFTAWEFSLFRIYFDLLSLIILTFLAIFLIERTGLDFLIDFDRLNINNQSEKEASGDIHRQSRKLAHTFKKSKFNAIFLANAYSQIVISLILFMAGKIFNYQ